MPEDKKLEFLKREEIKTMAKDIARLREEEAKKEREKITTLKTEEGARTEKEKIERIRKATEVEELKPGELEEAEKKIEETQKTEKEKAKEAEERIIEEIRKEAELKKTEELRKAAELKRVGEEAKEKEAFKKMEEIKMRLLEEKKRKEELNLSSQANADNKDKKTCLSKNFCQSKGDKLYNLKKSQLINQKEKQESKKINSFFYFNKKLTKTKLFEVRPPSIEVGPQTIQLPGSNPGNFLKLS